MAGGVRRHSRRGLVGGSTFRRTPISQSPLDKILLLANLALHFLNIKSLQHNAHDKMDELVVVFAISPSKIQEENIFLEVQ